MRRRRTTPRVPPRLCTSSPNVVTRRGLVVIISDLFDDPFGDPCSALRHFRHNQHDVLVMHVLDPREVDFNFSSAAVFKDMETGEELTTQPLHLRNCVSWERWKTSVPSSSAVAMRRTSTMFASPPTEPFDMALAGVHCETSTRQRITMHLSRDSTRPSSRPLQRPLANWIFRSVPDPG